MPFKKNDTVFGTDGREGRYIGPFEDEHIVAPAFEDPDGRTYYGSPETWRQAFNTAPIAKLDARVAELDAAIAEKSAALSKIRGELAAAERETADRLAKLKKYDALRRIEHYIDGKFAYFLVVPLYGMPRIEVRDALIANGDGGSGYDRSVKLLCLFGESKGDLQWKVNHYRDGSGDWMDVYPFASKGEAVEQLRRLYAEEVTNWRLSPASRKNFGRALEWASCPAEWLDVPSDVSAYIRERKLQYHQEAVDKARAALAEAEVALTSAQSA